jgi:hypothetical protein
MKTRRGGSAAHASHDAMVDAVSATANRQELRRSNKRKDRGRWQQCAKETQNKRRRESPHGASLYQMHFFRSRDPVIVESL